MSAHQVIVNVDEVFLSNSTKINYSWASKRKTKIVQNISFKGSQALIGAITSRGGWFIFRLHSHNNSDIFIDYIENLVEWLTKTQGIGIAWVALLMDNSPIHSSKKTVKYLNWIGCRIVFLSLYNPEYWPIELLFNLLKSNLSKHWKRESMKIADKTGWRSIRECVVLFSHEAVIKLWSKWVRQMKATLNPKSGSWI